MGVRRALGRALPQGVTGVRDTEQRVMEQRSMLGARGTGACDVKVQRAVAVDD